MNQVWKSARLTSARAGGTNDGREAYSAPAPLPKAAFAMPEEMRVFISPADALGECKNQKFRNVGRIIHIGNQFLIRSVSTAVLPLPAAAERRRFWPRASIAACCAVVHVIWLIGSPFRSFSFPRPVFPGLFCQKLWKCNQNCFQAVQDQSGRYSDRDSMSRATAFRS